MNTLLIILYLCLLWLLFTRMPFYKRSGISPLWFAIILGTKFLAGLFYNYIQETYYFVGDTFAFFNAGQVLVDLLWTQPMDYLKLTFGPSGYAVPDYLLQTVDDLDFWTDPSAYMMVRFCAILGLISNGSQSVMIALWQLLPITGLVAIYKVLKDLFPDRAKLLKYFLFFFPSILFWSAGIHKEALVVFSMGLMLYAVHFKDRIGIQKSLMIFIPAALFLMIIRDYIFAAFILSLFCYAMFRYSFLSLRQLKTKPLFLYLIFSIIAFIGISILAAISPRLSLFSYLVENQNFFLKYIQGDSHYHISPIEANAWSFIKNAPKALFSALVNPDITDINAKHFYLRLVSVIENLILLALIIWTLIRHRIDNVAQKNYIWLSVFFSLGLLILLGLVVNNLGALYRYKSNLLPILVPCLIGIMSLPGYLKKETNMS